MVEPQITIIVPIYNVAPYLRECLDSLTTQSMQNIEVICIDDGSSDGSGNIADEYKGDSRFRIIHTENCGLSKARNRGIDEAKSPWLMFVDSDDWVDKKFCELPFKAALKNDADLVIFGFYTAIGTRIKKGKHHRPGIIDQVEAVDKGGTVVWNKLYKKELFDEIRYPEGFVYEDIGTTHKLIYRAIRIVRIGDELYYHRYRNGSISHSVLNEKERLVMSKNRYEELISAGYPREKALARLCGAALRCYGRAECQETELILHSEKILKSIKKIPNGLTKREKIMMLCLSFNKYIYRFVYKAFLTYRFL